MLSSPRVNSGAKWKVELQKKKFFMKHPTGVDKVNLNLWGPFGPQQSSCSGSKNLNAFRKTYVDYEQEQID